MRGLVDHDNAVDDGFYLALDLCDDALNMNDDLKSGHRSREAPGGDWKHKEWVLVFEVIQIHGGEPKAGFWPCGSWSTMLHLQPFTAMASHCNSMCELVTA